MEIAFRFAAAFVAGFIVGLYVAGFFCDRGPSFRSNPPPPTRVRPIPPPSPPDIKHDNRQT